VFAANMLKLDLTATRRQRLMEAYLEMKAYPEVRPALAALRESGVRLALLSNLTESMLQVSIRNSGLEDFFEHVISTDEAKTYKPDPIAYQLGVEALNLKKEEIAFAAFAGWDAAGAVAFGYPTFWVNRQDFPGEELDVTPDATGRNLNDLVVFVKSRR